MERKTHCSITAKQSSKEDRGKKGKKKRKEKTRTRPSHSEEKGNRYSVPAEKLEEGER